MREVSPTPEIDAVQSVQLRLLEEIHSLCERNGIRYSLLGPAVVDYLRNGRITASYHDFQIGLIPTEFARLENVLRRKLPEGRQLEGRFNNYYFPNRSLLYSDSTTVYYNFRRHRQRTRSINIRIIPLKPYARGGNVAKYRDSWRSQRIETLKDRLVQMPHVLQRVSNPVLRYSARLSRYDWAEYLRVSLLPGVRFRHSVRSLGTVFRLSGSRVYETVDITLNGCVTSVYAELLERPSRVIRDLESLKIPNANISNVLIDANLSPTEYERVVGSVNLDELKYADYRQGALLTKIRRLERHPLSVPNFVRRVAFYLHTVKLASALAPYEHLIDAAIDESDIDFLKEALGEYRNVFLYFENWKMYLRPSDITFQGLMILLEYEGFQRIVSAARKEIEQHEGRSD